MEFYAYAESNKNGFVDLGYHKTATKARQACYRHAKTLGEDGRRLRNQWRMVDSCPDKYHLQAVGITFTYGEVDRGQYDYERPSIY